MKNAHPVNKFLLINIILLAAFGFFIFLSASLGLLGKQSVKYSSIVINQTFLGLFAGGIMAYVNSKIPYRAWKKYSFWLFLGSLILTAMVFIPSIGMSFAGAKRWILLGSISFQPSELLKIAYIIYLATCLSQAKNRVKDFKYGALPFLIITVLSVGILLFQPDNDTALVIFMSGGLMYFMAGANLKHVILVVSIAIITFAFVILQRPYVLERIQSFFDPTADTQSIGYQVDQSLIAIGSGGIIGRGFGRSIQKFDLLPEPIGDSIFAVVGEEFGFVGTILILILFTSFLIQSIRLSLLAKDSFGGLLMAGFAILIVSQSFINMASMLGIFPLSGLPLLFISHGGTALFFTMFASGIMLNISRFNNT